jgi:Sec-independent protein secretion pathway component TatC
MLLAGFLQFIFTRLRLNSSLESLLIITLSIIYTGLAEAFFTKLNLSAKVAFLIVIPLVAFHAYRFVEPGLYKREKPLILMSIIASPVLFFSGFFFVKTE